MYIDRLGHLYLLQGKFEESKRIWEQGLGIVKEIGEKSLDSLLHSKIAWTHLKSGNPAAAVKECEEAIRLAVETENLPDQRDALHCKGYALLELGSIDAAQKIAKELKELIKNGVNRKSIKYYYYLMGLIERKKGNLSGAISYFKQAIAQEPYQHSFIFYSEQAKHIEPLASAYYESGDLEKAAEEYKKILSLTLGRLYHGDIYAKAFYMLGKIYEQQGDIVKAIERYEKFLDLWKDADPGIAEVEDARERLAELKSQ